MAAPQNIVAVIFDFDDTLTDDTTTKLLETGGIDPKLFWKTGMKELTDAAWDPPLAYLKLLIDQIGEGKPLGKLTNARLQELGKKLSFYQGIPELFGDLQELAKEHPLSNPTVEFYIISGGLEEIIRGSSIAPYFREIWGCRFHEEGNCIKHVKNAISFTEKTKYLFAINKGLADVRGNPYSVNSFVSKLDRRIPFENMIYVGDGLTDVPCFSLLNSSGGLSFGVFDPSKEESAKKAWEKLVAPGRVKTMNSPRYRAEDDLGALLRTTVSGICTNLDLKMRAALRG